MSTTYSSGIVLSGGGARGFAHIGVLKALNEKGIFPEIISAVSAGSIIGALYADKKHPDQIFEILSQLDLFRMLSLNRPRFGMLRAKGIYQVLQKHLSVSNLEELSIPLIISATNFTKAQTEYFNRGNIIDAVMASSAIPLVIKPHISNGQMYVDGGLMNNLPVEPLVDHCARVIGVNVNPIQDENNFHSYRNFADRVLHLAIRANVKNNIGRCQLYLEPPGLMNYNLFRISSAHEIFQIGYEYTLKMLDKHES
ncbi:MAG: patatin-like phospholipase family protein [Bacteroidia bacterium]